MDNGNLLVLFPFHHILGGILIFFLLPFLGLTLITYPEFGERDIVHLNHTPYILCHCSWFWKLWFDERNFLVLYRLESVEVVVCRGKSISFLRSDISNMCNS